MSQAALNISDKHHNAKQSMFWLQLFGVLFFLFTLAAIGWGGWQIVLWMEDPKQRPISTLVISGDRHYTTDNDIRLAILALGEPKTFVRQDVDEIQQQIKKKLPWVKWVSVRKQWPDQLNVFLVEYVPFAYWNDDSLLDEQGSEFSIPYDRLSKTSYPLLYGALREERQVLDGYTTMSQVLFEKGFKLKAIEMTARSSWQLTLDNEIRLELGRKESLQRVNRFITLYPVLVNQTPPGLRIDYVDLRYDSGAAVSWVPVFIMQND